MGRIRGLALMGLTAWVGILLLDLTPRPSIPWVSVKLERWQAIRSEVSVLFVGSSRVYRHLSPETFDRSSRELGLDIKSFNLGIPAAKTPEVLRILREALTDPAPRLGWVLIEADGLYSSIQQENVDTWRAIWWHYPTETQLAIASVLDHAPTVGDMTAMTRRHLTAAMLRFLEIGRLQRLLNDRLISRKAFAERPEAVLGPDETGFVPHVVTKRSRQSEPRKEFEQGIEAWRLDVARASSGRTSACGPESLAPSSALLFRHLEATVRAAGAEPIFVVSPVLMDRCALIEAQRQGVIRHLLRFDDPGRYPELFAVDHRYDINHLNDIGADLYSERVATAFAGLVSGEGVNR